MNNNNNENKKIYRRAVTEVNVLSRRYGLTRRYFKSVNLIHSYIKKTLETHA